jgi:hypothetical protein
MYSASILCVDEPPVDRKDFVELRAEVKSKSSSVESSNSVSDAFG